MMNTNSSLRSVGGKRERAGGRDRGWRVGRSLGVGSRERVFLKFQEKMQGFMYFCCKNYTCGQKARRGGGLNRATWEAENVKRNGG